MYTQINKIKGLISRMYFGILGLLPEQTRIKIEFYRCHRKIPSFKNPITFSEKIQWRKIYSDYSKYTEYADKINVKKIVSNLLGDSWIIPTYWTGNTLPNRNEISWSTPFVVKTNHGSGSICFIKTSEDLENFEAVCVKVKNDLKRKYPAVYNEKWYDDIKPMILIEPLIGENLIDYKFYVFSGTVKYIHVDVNRHIDHRRVFFTKDWQRLDIMLKYSNEVGDLEKPMHLTEMISAAETLGHDFDFVRVDLYDTNYGPLFGEITFAPGSGLEVFSPNSVDEEFGSQWKID